MAGAHPQMGQRIAAGTIASRIRSIVATSGADDGCPQAARSSKARQVAPASILTLARRGGLRSVGRREERGFCIGFRTGAVVVGCASQLCPSQALGAVSLAALTPP